MINKWYQLFIPEGATLCHGTPCKEKKKEMMFQASGLNGVWRRQRLQQTKFWHFLGAMTRIIQQTDWLNLTAINKTNNQLGVFLHLLDSRWRMRRSKCKKEKRMVRKVNFLLSSHG